MHDRFALSSGLLAADTAVVFATRLRCPRCGRGLSNFSPSGHNGLACDECCMYGVRPAALDQERVARASGRLAGLLFAAGEMVGRRVSSVQEARAALYGVRP